MSDVTETAGTDKAGARAQTPGKWNIKGRAIDDPLLKCLHILTKIHRRPFTEEALKAGLPLVDNKLTPEIFVRAAKHASLSAQVVKRPLEKIKSMVLPAVLLLEDQQACILTDLKKNGKAQVIQPESGEGVQDVTLKTLEKHYTGYTIFIKPEYRFSERGDELTEQKDKHWFWATLFKTWPMYSEVLVASFFINLFGIALPLFIMNVYDRVVPNQAIETLWVLVIGIAVVFGFEFILRTLRGYLIDVAGKKVDLNLSSQIFRQAMGLKMANRPGSVGAFSNTVQGFEFFRDFITSSTVTILIDLPFVFLYIAIIALIGGSLAYIPLVMVPLVLLVGYVLQLPLQRITEDSYRHSAEKQATLIETLGAIEAVKSGGAEGVIQRKWEKVVGLAARAAIKLKLVSNSSINFSILAQQLTSVMVIIYGVYKISAGDLTVGGLIACTILAGRGLAPMSQVAGLLTRYHQSMHSLQSLDKVMDLPVERPDGQSYLHRPHLEGAVQFRDVTFQYPGQKVDALTNFSIVIKPGEKVGILGRIGSGKTTLAKLLQGFYEPATGMVLVDGTDLHQIDPADLRRNIGYVPQDIVLFYGSVKDNIALGAPQVDDDEILQASKLAGVDRFVKLKPEGYDMQVGERGACLSGGQRQSIAVARSILLNPKILLMDEPTNNMDEMTEKQLKAALKSYVEDKTLILTTHKPSMLGLVDRLVILEGGHIVADGPKDKVMEALSKGEIRVSANWSVS